MLRSLPSSHTCSVDVAIVAFVSHITNPAFVAFLSHSFDVASVAIFSNISDVVFIAYTSYSADVACVSIRKIKAIQMWCAFVCVCVCVCVCVSA